MRAENRPGPAGHGSSTHHPVPDLYQIDGNLSLGRNQQVLLLGISAQGTDDRVETNQTVIVLILEAATERFDAAAANWYDASF